MAIKWDEEKQYYIVGYSRRDPVTKISRNLQRRGIKTRKEAEKVYKRLQVELFEKFYEFRHPYWKDVVEKFLDRFESEGVAKSTFINYQGTLRKHTYDKWNRKRIHQIDTKDIRDLIYEDLKDFSEAFQQSALKYIRAVMRYAIEERLIQVDPTPKIKFKKKEKIKLVLTEGEIRKLLAEAKARDNKWYFLWVTACYTGLRNGELYALKWSKIDFERRTILIDESWTKENGFKDTKSGNDRVIELAQGLLPIFLELYQHRSNEFVLPRIKQWNTGNQSKFLGEFLKEIGLPKVRFHDLRASWATIMLSKGVEPIKVMAMGGWRDLKTMQIYIRKSGININGITDTLSF